MRESAGNDSRSVAIVGKSPAPSIPASSRRARLADESAKRCSDRCSSDSPRFHIKCPSRAGSKLEVSVIAAIDICFAEGPRWHEQALWWSDMHGYEVNRFEAGRVARVCQIPGRPSGLGWLPDGRLLVVSMTDKLILRREFDGTLVTHADLSHLAPRRLNDMVVDRSGRAYVGNFGFELDIEKPNPTVLICVHPDGASEVVADDLWFPNGAVITEDGRTLVIAETWRARLTAFDIDDHGGLSNRRVWAALHENEYPDGICLDAQGGIWVASPTGKACFRVEQGGRITDRIEVNRGAFACALGGDQGTSLFVCTAESYDPERQRRERNGRIEVFEVAIPRGAGG